MRLTTESYRLGKETEVDLLASSNAWTEAKINVARARIDLAVLARRFAANLGVSLP